MRGTFLQLALDSAYCKKSVDMLTGLKAQTRSGWFSYASSICNPTMLLWNCVILSCLERYTYSSIEIGNL